MNTMASKFGKVNNNFESHFTFSHLSDLLDLQNHAYNWIIPHGGDSTRETVTSKISGKNYLERLFQSSSSIILTTDASPTF